MKSGASNINTNARTIEAVFHACKQVVAALEPLPEKQEEEKVRQKKMTEARNSGIEPQDI